MPANNVTKLSTMFAVKRYVPSNIRGMLAWKAGSKDCLQTSEYPKSIPEQLRTIKKTNRGKKIINDLFTTIIKNPKKYIKSNDYKKNKERMVCDFIAGMTDRYAINLHNKIK